MPGREVPAVSAPCGTHQGIQDEMGSVMVRRCPPPLIGVCKNEIIATNQPTTSGFWPTPE